MEVNGGHRARSWTFAVAVVVVVVVAREKLVSVDLWD